MRKKEKRLIVSFYSTHDAMAFEEYCHEHSIAGRLIPLPREISAGCGLAWSTTPDEESMQKLLHSVGIVPQELRVLEV